MRRRRLVAVRHGRHERVAERGAAALPHRRAVHRVLRLRRVAAVRVVRVRGAHAAGPHAALARLQLHESGRLGVRAAADPVQPGVAHVQHLNRGKRPEIHLGGCCVSVLRGNVWSAGLVRDLQTLRRMSRVHGTETRVK